MVVAACAILTYLTFAALLVLCLPIQLALWLVTAPFDRTRAAPGRALRLGGALVVRSCLLWQVRVEGTGHRPRGACVVVANHESALDPVILCLLPWEMKWLAKASIFDIPWLGWALRAAGDIAVVRGDHDSGGAAMLEARRYLDLGMPVLIFPEGTRSRDGSMLPFKLGAFKLAIEAGVPVLPIALHGTADGMPLGSPWVRPARPVARVLEPEPVTGLGPGDAEGLRDRVRERIGGAVAQSAAERL